MSSTYDQILAEWNKVKKTAADLLALKGGTAEIFLYGPLGQDGISESQFAQAMAEAKGAKEVRLYVNSPGGSVFTAKAMMAQMERFPGKVTAYVDGIAASAASFLLVAANEVRMYPEARLMLHLPHGAAVGNADDFRDMADLLDQETSSLVRLYTSRSKLTDAQVLDILKAETWFTAREAVDAGLADLIEGEEPKAPAKRQPSAADAQRNLKVARMNSLMANEKRRVASDPKQPRPGRG